ncbi:MAG TPA: hypothetical protein VN364_06595 [Bellilinea sp.]|nr:hypothetical protein [Bellilinea sp.]
MTNPGQQVELGGLVAGQRLDHREVGFGMAAATARSVANRLALLIAQTR